MRYIIGLLIYALPIYCMESPRLTLVTDKGEEGAEVNDNSLRMMLSYYLTRESKLIEEKIYPYLAERVLLSYSVAGQDLRYSVDSLIVESLEAMYKKGDDELRDYKMKSEATTTRLKYTIGAVGLLGILTTACAFLVTFLAMHFTQKC